MGFLSGLLGGGGGSQSSSSASGYSALPQNLRNAFDPLGLAVAEYTNPNKAGVVDRFTPLQQTADETQAFNQIRQGFAPNAQSIQSDIGMQMNPYNSYVIDEINRQSQGQKSILNQSLNAAGQLGSNRQMLGANDIDLSRTNQIGGFMQGQYNTALQNALNILPQARMQDAAGLLGIGDFQRNLGMQTQQAPIAALQAGTSMLSPFVQGGTQTSSGTTAGSGMLGGVGQLASGAGALGKAYSLGQLFGFSDSRLKKDIKEVGEENGHKIYEFKYVEGLPEGKFIGVMAQEVAEIMPEAVIVSPEGFLAVDYNKIGVEFRRA